jgi:carboxypeptidase family protein
LYVIVSSVTDSLVPFRIGGKVSDEMRCLISIWAIAIVVLGFASSGVAAKKRVPLASVNFVVVRDENGKPIRNAAVVMHPVNDSGKQQRSGIELKTDVDGKASFDGVPYGKLRIQVLAQGFQTYGDDYDIDRPNLDLTIKMKRPAGQYSIYEEHPAEKKNDQPTSDEKKPQ